MSATWRATLLVVASACCFGSIAPLTAIAMRHGAALQGIQAWRYTTTAVVLTLFAWVMARRRTAEAERPVLPAPRPWWHPLTLLMAGAPQAAVATLALLALRWIPAATASFLFYTFPAWVALLGALRGTEPLTRLRVGALALALGGIGMMVGAPDAGRLHPAGVASSIGGALLYALYIPVLARLSQRYAQLDVARAIGVGGSTLFLTWAVATGTLFTGFDPVALAASVFQGVLSSVAFIGFLAGLSALGPVRTAITSTAEPFWTTMLGAVLLAQGVGMGTIAGGIGIMAAVVLLQRSTAASGEVPVALVPEVPGAVQGVASEPLHSSGAKRAGPDGRRPS